MKKCSTCNITKEKECFGKSSKSKDGLKYQCNECRSKYAKEYRIKNKEKTLEYAAKYRKANKEAIREYKRRCKNIMIFLPTTTTLLPPSPFFFSVVDEGYTSLPYYGGANA